MPAKIASFSACHAAGVARLDERVLGPAEAHGGGHALGRVERLDPGVHKLADVPSSGGMNDQALVSMRISELHQLGPAAARPP